MVIQCVFGAKERRQLRFHFDYRKWNNLTVKESYRLPRIDLCLNSIGGVRYFSTLNLRSGYWPTEVHPNDADKTVFISRSGQDTFTVLSMGLAKAPGQFQSLMDMVQSGLTIEVCLAYRDDIICSSRTFEEHLMRHRAIFDRLEQAELKWKASKCELLRSEVHFLGHIVTQNGLTADAEKIRVVAN